MIDVSSSNHYVGDCRALLAELPDACVQTCVTSPPYWGLRDYGTAVWDGGDPACDHAESKPSRTAASIASSTLGGSKDTVHASHVFRGNCERCGAVRIDRQIGLEPTPDDYVASLVEVFRGVRRVLRDDGTLWLNLGDSYGRENGPGNSGARGKNNPAALPQRRAIKGIKQKDLIGIPWMTAFALRADGWYLRSDVIWSKPSPMPESVRDRPTKSHEYIFLLSKSATYYYDADAIREPMAHPEMARAALTKANPNAGRKSDYQKDSGGRNDGGRHISGAGFISDPDAGRNKRSVWTVASQPYDGAHFATFPPKLIEPCILAGSRPGDLVLDPFFGSGTTGAVAEKHGRRWIGFDLNPEYAELAKERTAQRSLTLTGAPP